MLHGVVTPLSQEDYQYYHTINVMVALKEEPQAIILFREYCLLSACRLSPIVFQKVFLLEHPAQRVTHVERVHG